MVPCAQVRALVQLKANVEAQTKEGWTAVMSAAMNGHTDTVLALAELGADVHAAQEDGTTAMIKAAVNGRTETVRALAQLGADVHARTKAGATTVMSAAQVMVEELESQHRAAGNLGTVTRGKDEVFKLRDMKESNVWHWGTASL